MIPTPELKALRAFRGDKALKSDMLAEIKLHQKQDRIIKGRYGENGDPNFRGCAVGCSIHSLNVRRGKNIDTSNHSAYEPELGIPAALARLEDYLFEQMPTDKAMLFPAEFIQAIPVGADLSLVPAKFICSVLKDVVKLKYVKEDKAVVKAVLDVLKLWEDTAKGKIVPSAAWSAAWSAARSAAESAAWSAARSAARSAAESAAAYKMSRTLITLLKQAK